MRKKYSNVVVCLCGGEITQNNYWRSARRIDEAVAQYNKLPNAALLITSGISGHNKEMVRAESHEYKKYVEKNFPDMPQANLYVEDLSRDTVGNVVFSKIILGLIMESGGVCHWVSNKFHGDRLKIIVSSVMALENHHDVFILVDDCVDEEKLAVLYAEEKQSIAEFERAWSASESVGELLFFHHEFYATQRLLS